MPPFRPWADLPPDLLCHIGDSLDLNYYGSARGACTSWRRALAPLCPSLLVVLDTAAATYRLSAASLPTRRSFDLKPIPSGARCVGSSNGWLALSINAVSIVHDGQSTFSLFNPVTATKIILPPLIYKSGSVSKIVFAPNPARDDFAAAAICDVDRLAYVTAGARRWAVLDPVCLAPGDQLADVVYHESGRVYCLTRHGDVHVLRLPERRRREPIVVVVDDPSLVPAAPAISPSPLIVVTAESVTLARRRNQHNPMLLRSSVGPDLNAPAKVEGLTSLPFDPATSFAPPYNTVSVFTSANNLVFCEGNLYQIWRNAICPVTLQLPGGGHRRVEENEVFVLRYYPRRKPCWGAVTDLGGYSVFIGRNNAVSVYAQDVPGLKGSCVYWIGGKGRDQGMVFDMATGRSTACQLPTGIAPQSTICWYFLSDIVNNCNSINGGQRVYQTRARVQADREKQKE